MGRTKLGSLLIKQKRIVMQRGFLETKHTLYLKGFFVNFFFRFLIDHQKLKKVSCVIETQLSLNQEIPVDRYQHAYNKHMVSVC